MTVAAPFAAGEFRHGVVEHVVGEQELVEEAEVADGFQHGLVFVELDAVLPVVADLEGLSPFDAAGRRFQRSGQQVDERTFSNAVPSDNADSVVSLELIRKVFD